ncbi:MAG: DUF302 domain-containing protein [Desulfobulbus sp.]|jgi:uncharacterized protein (DUF302 family)
MNISADASGIITNTSLYPFADTVQRLLSALKDRGIKIFAIIDQQAEAKSAGLSMPPTTLILFGNPKAGTPLMLAQPASGLDLPLKVLITESVAGQVLVRYNDASYISRRHGMAPELAANLAPVEKLIAHTVAQQSDSVD